MLKTNSKNELDQLKLRKLAKKLQELGVKASIIKKPITLLR
ncbi:hypothetical protein [Bacillus sp. REN16]|nr:hypothetical protein [Bacillus sp. REN16]